MNRTERHSFQAALALIIAVGVLAASPLHAGPWVESIKAPQFIAVSVEEVDRSVDWYIKAFGLKKLDDTTAEDGSWRTVNLKRDELFVEIVRSDRHPSAGKTKGLFKVGFSVPDVEAVADRVADASGERPRIVDFEPHGIRILQLKDPDGNIIQLHSPLK